MVVLWLSLKPLCVGNTWYWIDLMPKLLFWDTPSKEKNVLREIDEISMDRVINCWFSVPCSWGLFTLFSLLCGVRKICILRKIKLCYFRGGILAKAWIVAPLCVTQGESGLLTPFPLPSFLFTFLPFLRFLPKLFTEPHFVPGTILVQPALRDIETLIIPALQMRTLKLRGVKLLTHEPTSAGDQNPSACAFCAASQE